MTLRARCGGRIGPRSIQTIALSAALVVAASCSAPATSHDETQRPAREQLCAELDQTRSLRTAAVVVYRAAQADGMLPGMSTAALAVRTTCPRHEETVRTISDTLELARTLRPDLATAIADAEDPGRTQREILERELGLPVPGP